MALTLTIIIVLATGIYSYMGFNNPTLVQKQLFYPYQMQRDNSWYRFITHGFLHADYAHLLINCFVLYQFGQNVEYTFMALFGTVVGKLSFITFYLLAVVASAYPGYLKHKDNPGYRALGASGATSALVFSSILFQPWQWFVFPPMPAILFGPAFLWYSSYMDRRGNDNIGHDAHFWGAIFGLVFTLAFIGIKRPEFLKIIWHGIISFGN